MLNLSHLQCLKWTRFCGQFVTCFIFTSSSSNLPRLSVACTNFSCRRPYCSMDLKLWLTAQFSYLYILSAFHQFSFVTSWLEEEDFPFHHHHQQFDLMFVAFYYLYDQEISCFIIFYFTDKLSVVLVGQTLDTRWNSKGRDKWRDVNVVINISFMIDVLW